MVTLESHSTSYPKIGKFSPVELEDLLKFRNIGRSRAAQRDRVEKTA
jgi:hypothetical protein